MKKSIDVIGERTGNGIEMSELGTMSQPIERCSERDILNGVADIEKLMNERLTIYIYPDPRPGALQIVRPQVGEVRQPILRGVMSKGIKRKYVEVLARSVTTTYNQARLNPMNPAAITNVPTTSQSYPFTVHHDPNPIGPEWLQAILDERK